MKKVILSLTCLILMPLCLSGCLSLSTELSDVDIVGALGIDFENGVFKATILCFNTDLAESAEATFDVAYITGEGNNLYTAFESARASTTKKLFFGHNTVLVLGRNLAEKRLYEAAVYLSQDNETRLNISVFMADDKAEDIVKLKTSNKAHISGTIENLADNKPNGLDIKVQLFQIMQKMPDKGICGFLPVLESVEIKGDTAAGESPEKLYDIVMKKIAVFDDSSMLGEAAGDVMTGIFLVENRVETLDVAVKLDDGIECYGILMRTDTKISFVNDNSFTVEFVLKGAVSIRGKSDFTDEITLKEIKAKFEQEAGYYVRSAYNYLKDDLNTDLFNTQWYAAKHFTYTEAESYYSEGNIPEGIVMCQLNID